MDAELCWIITDGKAGMESQCLGLAEALGIQSSVKRVVLKFPWRQLTPYLRIAQSRAFARESDPLIPPWPDLVIATGRQSVATALYIRARARQDGSRMIAVQLQNPGISPAHFDLVVAPRHDRLEGPNVVTTRGALHRITPARLSEGAARLMPRVGAMPRPFVGVLIGGSNAAYRFDAAVAGELGAQLASAVREIGGSLLVTTSRRTSRECEALLRQSFAAMPHYFWDGKGDNPYFGILGLSDFLVVTSDSVNMVSEALSTGRPVHVAELPGGSRRFGRFHRSLRDEGLTRRFEGRIASYAYAVPDDMTRVLAAVRGLLDSA
jgi:hypothetical protein